jgi:hypothetical protein
MNHFTRKPVAGYLNTLMEEHPELKTPQLIADIEEAARMALS